MDKLENFNYENKDKLKNKDLYNFLTGKGGIFYKPSFFHKTGDLIFNEKIFLKTNPTQDDIWFYIVRILNNVSCFISAGSSYSKDFSKNGLFVQFNHKNNFNTTGFKKVYDTLKNLSYF